VLQRAVRFTPVDILTSAFAALLCLVGLVCWSTVSDHGAIAQIAAVGLLPLFVGFLRARVPRPGRALAIFFDFYMIACVVVIFDNLGPLIHAVSPVDRDAWLIAFDRAVFGTDPTLALERFATPLLSDVLTVFYALYYFHPIVLGGIIYADDLRGPSGRTDEARCRRHEFPRYAFTMVFVFFVSYAGYFALPAIGPRYTIRHEGPLPRGAVARTIDDTLDRLEKNKRDCFPSGHTMVVTAVLMAAAHRSRKTFLWFLPFAVGLVLATVYCRYHYVADVLAGALLAFPAVPLGNALYRWLEDNKT
jgi:membrane-associated phospholipid phosphatase